MNTITRTIGMLALLAGLGGCSVAYSSIRQEDDGTYILTESKARAFKVQGQVYRCVAEGTKMTCQLIARPRKK